MLLAGVGCGADAAPYFRIFNPILQGEKFDPQGLYTTKWLPELASMPKKYIHRPWEAPQDVLVKAKIVLGEHYPHPIVDLGTTRDKALELYNIHVKKQRKIDNNLPIGYFFLREIHQKEYLYTMLLISTLMFIR